MSPPAFPLGYGTAALAMHPLDQALLPPAELPRKKKYPWFTRSMILVNTLVFGYTMYKADWEFAPMSQNPLLGPTPQVNVDMGAKVTALILNGQAWRLVSSMFLHGGVLHLGFNMVSLYKCGEPLEEEFGAARVAVVYFLAGLTGNMASAVFLPLQITVGASGAIFGLFGATWAEFVQNYELFDERCKTALGLLLSTAVSLAIGLMPLVDNFAHVGGFLGGLLAGMVLMVETKTIESYRDGSIHEHPGATGDYWEGSASPRGLRADGSNPKGQCCCCVCSVMCWRQCFCGIVCAAGLVVYLIVLLTCLFNRVDPRGWCSFCDDVNCLETPWWDCNADSLANCQPAKPSGQVWGPAGPPCAPFPCVPPATGGPWNSLSSINVTCIDSTTHYIANAGQYVDVAASEAKTPPQLMLTTQICIVGCT